MAMLAGLPQPLGATRTAGCVNFALFSSHAARVELAIYGGDGRAEIARRDLPARTGDVWHGALPSAEVPPGSCYAYHVHGALDPSRGLRFDARLPLLDPYAREVTAGPPLRARLPDGVFDWGDDRPPAVPWRDTVVYELHVKGYTQLHPGVPSAWRGKYLGLSVPAVIDHMKSIGVTAVELLPCQAFLSEAFLSARNLTNYWGYNSVAWFAPSPRYALHDAVAEFKTMVKALHAAGIEVILDVVFNHTAEGNEVGPTLNLKGIDNPTYYRLMPDARSYENLTGCGNTVNCEHPQVRTLIVDCLRYWAEEMHVDGFRFDLAPVLARDGRGFDERSPFFSALREDPVLASVKLIAEPWDVGPGGYQLGRFPAGWSEWNDRYRDTVRAFWRCDGGKVGETAERIAGSSDLFRHNGRKPTASVNFITAHDGFTLHDLVSYEVRHNEANLESNADGTGNNLSCNCGVEGVTEDPAVLARRGRQMRNLLAILFFSQGVPMLQAGDEFARTQHGNNNAYAQDNELSWVDWRNADAHADLLRFVQRIAHLRRRNAEFRRASFFKGTSLRKGVKDISWLHWRGSEMTHEDWQNGSLCTLGALFAKRNHPAGRLLLLLNAADSAQKFVLPAAPPGSPWVCHFDTARATLDTQSLGPVGHYHLAANCTALLEC